MFFGRKEKGNFVAGLLFVAVILVGTWFAVFDGSRSGGEESVDLRVPVDLNEVLTNELSQWDALDGLDTLVLSFMKKWELDGAQLVIVRHDSLLYAKGYGFASITDSLPMRPGTLQRLASVSKLVTAAGIMRLCEMDSLSLDSRVFGPDGILRDYNSYIRAPYYDEITVRHLLMHSSGLSCRAGGDPLFPGVYVDSQDAVLRGALRRRLAFRPGEGSEYSNLGYLLLSMVIEKVTGRSYEDWMQEYVLRPAGCHDFHIAGSTPGERLSGETCYGRDGVNNVRLLSGAGAWVASAPELARFVASIDGRGGMPDILSSESVAAMTFPTDSVTYALG